MIKQRHNPKENKNSSKQKTASAMELYLTRVLRSGVKNEFKNISSKIIIIEYPKKVQSNMTSSCLKLIFKKSYG